MFGGARTATLPDLVVKPDLKVHLTLQKESESEVQYLYGYV